MRAASCRPFVHAVDQSSSRRKSLESRSHRPCALDVAASTEPVAEQGIKQGHERVIGLPVVDEVLDECAPQLESPVAETTNGRVGPGRTHTTFAASSTSAGRSGDYSERRKATRSERSCLVKPMWKRSS